MKRSSPPAPIKPVKILRPVDLQARYGKSPPTIWRWERDGTLPKRDVYRDGEPWGWYESTIEASERQPEAATA